MTRTLNEWLAYYEKHTGEAFDRKDGFQFFFYPDKGFCEYRVEGKDVYIWQLCGDLAYWVNTAYRTARRMKLRSIAAIILRKPRPFIRALGFRVVETENRDGQIKYYGENAHGEKLTATPWSDRYIFTWEVNPDEKF